jgi:hypothetical protein
MKSMNILDLKSIVAELFSDRGLSEFWSNSFALILLLILFLVLGRVIFWITRKVIAGFLSGLRGVQHLNLTIFLFKIKSQRFFPTFLYFSFTMRPYRLFLQTSVKTLRLLCRILLKPCLLY